jgi:hypothetical protein
MDEDYFVANLSLSSRAVGPDAARVRIERWSSPVSPRRERMARQIIKGTKDVAVHSPAGLYLGQAHAYDVDLARINRVIIKIVRGLYWHEFRMAVPPSMNVSGFIDPPLDALDARTLRILLNKKPTAVGGTVFQYWHAPAHDLPDVAVFLLNFYQGHFALGLVMPQENVKEMRAAKGISP